MHAKCESRQRPFIIPSRRRSGFLKQFRHWLMQSWMLCLAFHVTLRTIGAMPLRISRAFGRFAGAVTYSMDRSNVRRGLRNLAAAFPEYTYERRQRILKDCYKHLGVCLFEACYFRTASPAWMLSDWIIRDPESEKVMKAAIAENKGVICVSAHAGFWELTGFIFPSMGYPCVCIANRLPAPGINAEIRRIRARLGNEIVDQEGALVHILRALKEKKTVGIIMDHWGKSKSPKIPFFGRETRTLDTVARLHLKTDAPIISSMMFRQPDGRYQWRCKRILTPILTDSSSEKRINEILRQCNQDIESAIRENPEQWTWMHNRWRDS